MPSPVCPPIACALFIGCLELAASIMMCMLHDDDLEQYIQHENFQVLDPDNIFFIPFLTFKNFVANIANIFISLLLLYGLIQRNRWFLVPWLIKEAVIVMVLFGVSVITFGVLCFLIGEMIYKQLGIHSYPGAFLFVIYIPYSVVLLIVDVLSICFWVEIYNIYDFIRYNKQQPYSSTYRIDDVEAMEMTPIQL